MPPPPTLSLIIISSGGSWDHIMGSYHGIISWDPKEFCKWIAMWEPRDEEADGGWWQGGRAHQRVQRADGEATGRVGRLQRLMQILDADNSGRIECWEFVQVANREHACDRLVISWRYHGDIMAISWRVVCYRVARCAVTCMPWVACMTPCACHGSRA